MCRWIRCSVIAAAVGSFVLLATERAALAEIHPEFLLPTDPQLPPVQTVKLVSEKFAPLWQTALARPDADLQRLTAQAIAEAYGDEVPGLEALIPRLIEIASAPETNLTTRRAVVTTLIALDATAAGPTLFDVSRKYGTDIRQIIEPALARWKFEPIRKVWLDRLESAETRVRDLVLAADGLASSGDQAAVPSLLKVVFDPHQPRGIKLAAARAAGLLQATGLVENARRLIAAPGPGILERLCAVALLESDTGPEARAVLQGLADHAEPTIAAASLTRLNAIDPDLVLPFAEKAMQSADPLVRRQGAACYLARPTPERIGVVARRLDDFDPTLRGTVREALFHLAQQPDLDAAIRAAAMTEAAGDSWRGQEQATLLLAALIHRPAAQRFVELLESTRGEVMVAAGWGLRKLAVPETLPAILDKATRQSVSRKKMGATVELDLQVAHLLEAMGDMNFTEAEPLMRTYIPKDFIMGLYSRPAAIWALGKLHAGQVDEELAKLLSARLTDSNPFPPETDGVRSMSAVALGRMKAMSQLPAIRGFLGAKVAPINHSLAMRWAIHELTGELLPLPDPLIASKANFFLEPLDNPLDELVPVKK